MTRPEIKDTPSVIHLVLLFLLWGQTESKWFTVDHLLDHARKCNNATHFSCPFHLTCCNKFTEKCSEFESETADCIKIPLLDHGKGFPACCREVQNSTKLPSEQKGDVCEYLLSSWPGLREEVCRDEVDEVPQTKEITRSTQSATSLIPISAEEKYQPLPEGDIKANTKCISTNADDGNWPVIVGVLAILLLVSLVFNFVLGFFCLKNKGKKRAKEFQDANALERLKTADPDHEPNPGLENQLNSVNEQRHGISSTCDSQENGISNGLPSSSEVLQGEGATDGPDDKKQQSKDGAGASNKNSDPPKVPYSTGPQSSHPSTMSCGDGIFDSGQGPEEDVDQEQDAIPSRAVQDQRPNDSEQSIVENQSGPSALSNNMIDQPSPPATCRPEDWPDRLDSSLDQRNGQFDCARNLAQQSNSPKSRNSEENLPDSGERQQQDTFRGIDVIERKQQTPESAGSTSTTLEQQNPLGGRGNNLSKVQRSSSEQNNSREQSVIGGSNDPPNDGRKDNTLAQPLPIKHGQGNHTGNGAEGEGDSDDETSGNIGEAKRLLPVQQDKRE